MNRWNTKNVLRVCSKRLDEGRPTDTSFYLLQHSVYLQSADFTRHITGLPTEMVEKILLEAALMTVDPIANNGLPIYRNLAGVCRLWRSILDKEIFHNTFLTAIAALCEFVHNARSLILIRCKDNVDPQEYYTYQLSNF